MGERNRWYLVLGVLLGVIVLVAGVVTINRVVRVTQKDSRALGLPIAVQIAPATVRTLQQIIGASGSIQPSYPINITAQVAARVLHVPVDVGSIVHTGDLLADFDPSLYAAAVTSAQETYDHDHNQLLRMVSLHARHFASDSDVENARVAEATAADALVGAKISLGYTRVVCPVPAVVLVRTVNPGETAAMNESIFQLGVLDPVEMDAAVSEDKSGYVYLGMPAEVGTDAFPGVTFTGVVSKTDSLVNDTTRTFGAYIRLANHDLKLRKGVTGYARLMSTRMGLAVPSTAIMNPVGDKATVFVIGSDKHAHLRQVRIGLNVGDWTEVLEGLSENEQVVTVGQYDLHDNDPVLVNRFAPWNKS